MEKANQLFIPFDPEYQLKINSHYPIIGEQIIFLHNDQIVVTTITNEKDFTAEDYMLLPESAPYELINGKLIFMASPFFIHQRVSSKLSIILGNYIYSNKLGEILTAPMDVHFDNKNVFQPDLLFVSIKRNNIIKRWIMGAPDFIIEISSKSTDKQDHNEKMQTYGSENVLEYWIVKPQDEAIEIYHNKKRKMQLVQNASKNDTVESIAIKGLKLKVSTIFE